MSKPIDLTEQNFDKPEDHVFLSRGRKLAYGCGGITDAVMFNGISGLFLIYTVIFQIHPGIVGSVLLFPRIWDAMTDPIMGQISDNTRTRWGRRRPYILVGGVVACITFPLIFFLPESYTGKAAGTYLFITSTLFYTAITVYFVCYNALGLEMSLDYAERSRVMAYRTFFESFGMLLPFWAIPFISLNVWETQRMGAKAYGIASGIIALTALYFVVFKTREIGEFQKQEKVRAWDSIKYTFKNRNFLTISGAIIIFQLGLVSWIPLMHILIIAYVCGGNIEMGGIVIALSATSFAVGQLFTVGPIAWLSTRIGKDKTLALSITVTGIGMFSTWMFYTQGDTWRPLYINLIMIWCLPAFQFLPRAIMADICDMDELETGRRREGMFASSLSMAQKIGIAGAVAIAGYVLTFIGYDQTAELQTPDVMQKLRIACVTVPPTLMLFAGLSLFFLKVPEKRVREVRELLNERRAKSLAENLD